MVRYEFKLPDIGEGVSEGEIVGWHINPGDFITEDEPLVDVMTDKATVTITSPKSGRIVERIGNVGEVVKVHATLVVYEIGGVPTEQAPADKSGEGVRTYDSGPAATAVGDVKDVLPGMGGLLPTATGVRISRDASPTSGANVVSLEQFRPPRANHRSNGGGDEEYEAPDGKALATPATRKLARDLGVDLAKVRPSGTNGRVTKEDVRQHVSEGHSVSQCTTPGNDSPADTRIEEPRAGSHEHSALRRDLPLVSIASPTAAYGSGSMEQRVPFRGLRRRIAERMQTSKHTAAHSTFVEECDVTALKALRERLKPKAAEAGVKLSYLPFIIKAVVASLAKHPALNSALDEATEELVYRKYYNIGIATATEQGLMVPVVKRADALSLLNLAHEIERLGTSARASKLVREDLQDGTFTITSLGALGGLFATPIINFPEVAILGVHQIKQKPVVRNGQIVIGDVMLLSLSFDHRVIDGHVGAAFAYEVIGYLQDPDRLMLEL